MCNRNFGFMLTVLIPIFKLIYEQNIWLHLIDVFDINLNEQ